MSKTRVLLIGLDGATFDIIKPRLGELPSFARLLSRGVHGPLRTTMPPMTSPAWPSFATGKNPGKLDVYDFLKFNKKTLKVDITTSRDVKSETLWHILGREGKKVCVVEIPLTFPPSRVNGIMVAGYPSPGSEVGFYPREIFGEICREVGEFRDPFVPLHSDKEWRTVSENLLGLLKNRRDVVLSLLKKESWDLFAVNFHHLDTIAHYFWFTTDPGHPKHENARNNGIPDLVLQGYREMDEVLGGVLSEIDDETDVFIISDHGQGPLKKMVNLNNFLMERGYITLRRNLKARIKKLFFRAGVNPANIYSVLKFFGLQDLTVKFGRRKRAQVLDKFLSFSDIDWERTLAFSFGSIGQVYINRGALGDQENNGEKYEEIRERLVQDLSSLMDEDGKPVVDEIYKREEIYRGGYVDNAPDLLLKMRNFEYISYPLFSTGNELFVEPIHGNSGGHRMEGVFIAYGPNIKTGEEINGVQIIDIAPTVLHLLGLPVPGDMDGRVVMEIFREGSDPRRRKPMVGEVRGYKGDRAKPGESEEREIKDRLRALGYM